MYWREETFGTTKDINEAHHYDENEASEITHLARGVEAIGIPNEGRVTIKTRGRYWLYSFGRFTEDRSEAAVYSREFAEELTRNYSEDTVIENIDIDENEKSKGGWGPGGYLERPINEFEECTKVDPGVQGKFEGILTSLNSLLEYKNKKYGNVALDPLNIFAKYGGIGQRLDDKLSRIKNAEELRKNDVADMLGYLVLLCKEHGFENFDEFKD